MFFHYSAFFISSQPPDFGLSLVGIDSNERWLFIISFYNGK